MSAASEGRGDLDGSTLSIGFHLPLDNTQQKPAASDTAHHRHQGHDHDHPSPSSSPPPAKPCTTDSTSSIPIVLTSSSYHFLRLALLRSPLLSSLASVDAADEYADDPALSELIHSAQLLALPAGSFLVKQDELGNEFYIIAEGEVDIVKSRPKQQRQRLETGSRQQRWLSSRRQQQRQQEDAEDAQDAEESSIVAAAGPGDVVGELSVFYDIPRQASLLTRTDSVVYAISRAAFQQFLSSHPDLSSSLRQRRWLREVLKQHYLFSHLDNEAEKERLITAFRPRYFASQQRIIQQGDEADEFFIVAEGDCEVSALNAETRESVPVAVVHPNQSFGEVALLYATQRSATVSCLSEAGCTVWSVSGKDFLSHCQRGSLFLQHVFYRFAKQDDGVTHERRMSRDDFAHAMRFINRFQRTHGGDAEAQQRPAGVASSLSSTPCPLSDSRLRLMFRLADVSGDSLISFSEFLHLHILLTHPHSCAELAFRMFDKNCNGSIEKDEFIRVVRWLAEDRGEKLDLVHSRYLNELFGSSRSLSFDRFESLLRADGFPSFLSGIRADLQAIDLFASQLDTSLPLSAALLSDTTSLISLPPQLQSLDQIDDHLFRLPWRTLIAGGIAGGISRTLVSPLERLKILFQTQGGGMKAKYTSVTQGLRVIYAEDGVKGLFRGNGSNVLRIVPAVALQFAFYDLFKRYFFDHPWLPITQSDSEKRKKELGATQRLLAGAGAGIAACVLTYPLDFIRARLTLQSGPDALYGGIVDAARQVYRKEGVLGFYHGLWPSVVGIAPYLGLDLAVYEGLKRSIRRRGAGEGVERECSKAELFACGAAAGSVGQAVAYPIDTIRRRMQVQGFAGASYAYSGSISRTLMQIVREEGVRGLYKGMWPNLCKVAPAVSVSFVVYEYMRELLGLEAL